jgi:hypothetical protein
MYSTGSRADGCVKSGKIMLAVRKHGDAGYSKYMLTKVLH